MFEQEPSSTNIKDLVDSLQSYANQFADNLADVAKDLWDHPEIRFTEYHAAKRLTAELEDAGFEVTRGFGGLETAFVGKWSSASATADSPTLAVFCEYDALEEVGHACGHNIIAASGLGAAKIAKADLEADGKTGAHLVVIGSPGEEGGAGKVPLIENGVLEGVDYAVMIHPSNEEKVGGGSLARVALDVEFKGKASHAAAAPEDGRNALDAATLSLNAIGLLRQQIKDDIRIHSIITNGGQAPNVIPELTGIRTFVRGSDSDYLLESVVPRVKNCFEAGALATDCTVSITSTTPPYLSLKSNPTLVTIAEAAFSAVGRQTTPNELFSGSTDMGNVSQVVPAIHPMIRLTQDAPPHTREFAAAADGPDAKKTIIDGALILAATLLAGFRDPEVVEEAKRTFNE
ncbi:MULTISPECIES: M20 family metallopeptidase [Corynebacterium]|nr:MULTISPECIES: M20 family metallopeptidase [Corynebacterium]KKO77477.1 hypothetical protein WU87_11805 [Corynebacterium minutissimum]